MYHMHALCEDGVLLLHLINRGDVDFARTASLECLLLDDEIHLHLPALLLL